MGGNGREADAARGWSPTSDRQSRRTRRVCETEIEINLTIGYHRPRDVGRTDPEAQGWGLRRSAEREGQSDAGQLGNRILREAGIQ